MITKNCLNCGKEFERGKLSDVNWKRKKYCSRRCLRNYLKRVGCEKVRAYFLKYKRKNCCAFCGWKEHPDILQFHHEQKRKENIHLADCKSIKQLKEQLKKGILLCPNCHVWHHYKEGDYFLGKRY